MKIGITTVGLLVAVVLWLASTAVNAQIDARSTADAEIRTLLVARRDAFKKRFEFIKSMNDNGAITHAATVEAHELLLQAELELAPTKKVRAEIHEKRIKNYQHLEKTALNNSKIGTEDGAGVQLAIANRMQAEIDSLRDANRK